MGHCIVLDVDGEPVRLQLNVRPDQLTDEDRAGLIELARLVRSQHPKPSSKTGSTPLATPTPCPDCGVDLAATGDACTNLHHRA